MRYPYNFYWLDTHINCPWLHISCSIVYVMWHQWYTSHFPSWPPLPLQYRSAHWSASRPCNESGFSFIVAGQYQSCLFANLVWLMHGSVYVLVNTNCSTLLIIVVISLPQRVQFFKFSVFFRFSRLQDSLVIAIFIYFKSIFSFRPQDLGKVAWSSYHTSYLVNSGFLILP